MGPAIIEVALNGATTKAANPHVPVTPEEIGAEALRCIAAGASIIHNHIEDMSIAGETAGRRYGEGWARILASAPDAILCPTTVNAPTTGGRVGHIASCAAHGATMAPLDTGSVNLVNTAPNGAPGAQRYLYINSFEDLEAINEQLVAARLGPSVAVFDPTFLRIALAYHRAGVLPPGTLIKLYFGGDFDFSARTSPEDGRVPKVSFGLPPTSRALDAYLEMLEGSGLPWSVAVVGGDVVESGMARLALERGGHVRVGLEDYRGAEPKSNAELVSAAAAVCREIGREPASCAEARAILGFQQ
jgi:3-keto-5-aminohexanoate cleavage enzyme